MCARWQLCLRAEARNQTQSSSTIANTGTFPVLPVSLRIEALTRASDSSATNWASRFDRRQFMIPLLFESYLLLLRLEFLMHFGISDRFILLFDRVKSTIQHVRPTGAENICRAIDIACVLYGHRVLCLQRSAAAHCSSDVTAFEPNC